MFFTCPVGDINFKGDELSDIDQYPRSIWISSEKDEEIPTVTSKNSLLYISDTKVPEEIVFERFAGLWIFYWHIQHGTGRWRALLHYLRGDE